MSLWGKKVVKTHFYTLCCWMLGILHILYCIIKKQSTTFNQQYKRFFNMKRILQCQDGFYRTKNMINWPWTWSFRTCAGPHSLDKSRENFNFRERQHELSEVILRGDVPLHSLLLGLCNAKSSVGSHWMLAFFPSEHFRQQSPSSFKCIFEHLTCVVGTK